MAARALEAASSVHFGRPVRSAAKSAAAVGWLVLASDRKRRSTCSTSSKAAFLEPFPFNARVSSDAMDHKIQISAGARVVE